MAEVYKKVIRAMDKPTKQRIFDKKVIQDGTPVNDQTMTDRLSMDGQKVQLGSIDNGRLNESPEDYLLKQEIKNKIEKAIKLLTKRQQAVLRLRMMIGLDRLPEFAKKYFNTKKDLLDTSSGYTDGYTLEQVAEIFSTDRQSVSRERIRDIEAKALRRLRILN